MGLCHLHLLRILRFQQRLPSRKLHFPVGIISQGLDDKIRSFCAILESPLNCSDSHLGIRTSQSLLKSH
jgi:hypothetical protein